MLSQIPNLISLARLGAVPVVVWAVLDGHHAIAFWLFVAAGVSDALDGFIAKRFRAESVFGAFLDPIADKALLVGVYVSLAARDALPIWLVILVVFRDLLIVGGALLVQAMTQRLSMQPLVISKVNTAAQIALAAFLLGKPVFGIALPEIAAAGVATVAATTFLSGVAYVTTWWRKVRDWERER